MTIARWLYPLLLASLLASPMASQQPDSVPQLPDLGVRASRSSVAAGAFGLSITTLHGDSARRGRLTVSLDELLAFVPGVSARHRSDYSLDTRITMRGAGVRANFGVRGIRVVVDGVPATLPDGQTPLTHLDLDLVERVDVARGPLASLHGNGSLGVVSLATPARLGPGLKVQVRGESAVSSALTNGTVVVGGGNATRGGLVAVSWLDDGGMRHHASAEQWRVRSSGEWKAGEATTFTLRGAWAHDPQLQSPGALTLEEFALNPNAAAPNSINRNAGKQLDQQQVSLGMTHRSGSAVIDANAWSIWRALDNPLAAPAPAPTTATEGTWVGIDRRVIGGRTTIQAPFGPRLIASVGIDAQRMVDDRINRRHDAGEVSGAPFLDQQERVAELGGFGQVILFAGHGVSLRLGGRHDRVTFMVDDHLDPAAGGDRTMAAWSGGGAVAWRSERVELWWGVGSAFETPTTTELANQPDGSTGLNRALDPARTFSMESGARFAYGRLALEMVGFATRTTDAITAVAESGGRSYFANVGTTTTRGVEATVTLRPHRHVTARGSMTALRSRFGEQATSAAGAQVSGNALPGVVPLTGRLGVTYANGRVLFDVDQAWSASAWANDENSVKVPGWGPGVTSASVRLRTGVLALPVSLHLGVRNLFDRAHATGIVVNGGFGRVVEPGTGRRVVVGVELTSPM